MIDKPSFFQGVYSSYPVCIAFTLMYCAVGMLGGAEGRSLGELLASSALIFSVPLQAFVITNPDSGVVSTIINTLILNFRFMLMTVILVPLWIRNRYTLASMQLLCGSTYMVCASEKEKNDNWSFFLGVSVPSYIVALLATASGYYLWDIGGSFQSFMHALTHIILPLHFTCLTLKRKGDAFVIASTVAGVVLTPLLSLAFGKGYVFIAWIVLAGIIVFVEEWVCGKLSLSQA